jgi:hypothetical protein
LDDDRQQQKANAVNRRLRTALLAAALMAASAGCESFNCAASASNDRSAGGCGAHTTFLR